MRQIDKTIDINAHIENLECCIEIRDGSVYAIISFDNLAYGDITAIKFNAIGYNSFGDAVEINGNTKFFLIIQDVEIKKNEKAKDLKAKLPDCDIRKMVLEECQICFKDGSVVTYEGKDERNISLKRYENNGAEGEKLKALKSKFGEKFIYEVADFDFGWVCSCGRLNRVSALKCELCGCSKNEMITAASTENEDFLMQEYGEKEEKRKNIIKVEEKKKEKERKQKNIKIGIASIIGIIILGLLINACILSGRKTYASEDKMRSDIEGTWTCYGASGRGMWQIIIKGDKLGQIWEPKEKPSYTKDIVWNPSRGTFKAGSTTYTIKSDGKIVEGDYEYQKGGTISSLSSSTTSNETMRTALKISNISVTTNSSYTVCTGTVTNNGKKSYDYVKVKGSFKDSSGKVLDTDWSYAVGSEGLDPGESTTFRLSVSKNSSITDCSVSFMD